MTVFSSEQWPGDKDEMADSQYDYNLKFRAFMNYRHYYLKRKRAHNADNYAIY